MVDRVPFKDKVGHFVLYGFMAFLLDLAMAQKAWRIFGKAVPAAIILVTGFAVVEEITQLWIAARTFDFMDVTADFLGVVLFVFVGRNIRARKEYHPENRESTS